MATIKVTSNKSKRTFTIRRYDNYGKCYAKYRTIQYSAEEFRDKEYNTDNDWKYYLQNTDEYYKVR